MIMELVFKSRIIKSLTNLPASDLNFVSLSKKADAETIESAIEIMKKMEHGAVHKTRIKACEKELRRRKNEADKSGQKA